METEAIPSLWQSVHSWFTPTVLFLLLNLVIGTIAVTSKSSHGSHGDVDDGASGENPKPSKLARVASLSRSPSIVLERIRSFNLYSHRYAAPPPAAEEEEQQQLSRSQSDAKPTAAEMPEKLPGKIKKSASESSAFAHFKEDDVAVATEPDAAMPVAEEEVQPATAVAEAEDDEKEVDARADAFINRFKHQLKLQRIDSIMRYKEMISHGGR